MTVIYLDNAATSFPKPPEVISAVNSCLAGWCANPGRSSHSMSAKCARAVNDARESLAALFGVSDPMRICFAKNATEALNTAIQGFCAPFWENGSRINVVTTAMEHNSVLRPLFELERAGRITLTVVKPGGPYGLVTADDIRFSCSASTRLVAVTMASNVNGVVMPAEEIGRAAGERGAAFLLDASQGAGCIDIDVEAMNVSMLAFPGHKCLMGPQGTGGLYVKPGVRLAPLMRGGTGSMSENPRQPSEMPDMLESGTLNTPGIAGLGAAAEHVRSVGPAAIGRHKAALAARCAEGLSTVPGIHLYNGKSPAVCGLVTFNIDGMDSCELACALDSEFGIAARGGLHCAPLAHRTLGTLGTGAVRFSFGLFNTESDADAAVEAVHAIAQNMC